MAISCNTKLYRKRQLISRLETDCSVLETDLVAADGGLEANVSPSVETSVDMVQRDVARATITPLAGVAGMVSGSVKFSTDFKGPGLKPGTGAVMNTYTEADCTPAVGKYLEACAMNKYRMLRLTVDPAHATPIVISAPYLLARPDLMVRQGADVLPYRLVMPLDPKEATKFVYLEYTGGTGLATGVGPDRDPSTASPLEFFEMNGAMAVLVASVRLEASSLVQWAGCTFKPTSSNMRTITIRSEEDGFQKTVMGAMGNLSLSADNSKMVRMEFDFSGAVPDGFVTMISPKTPPATESFTAGEVLIVKNVAKTAEIGRIVVRKTFSVTLASGITKELWFNPAIGSKADFTAPAAPLPMFRVNTDGTTTELTVLANFNTAWRKASHGDMPMTADVKYHSTVPPTMRNAGLLMVKDGKVYRPAFSSVSVASGNDVSVRQSGNSALGVVGGIINSRSPSASLDPEMMTEADFDYFGYWFDGALSSLQFNVNSGKPYEADAMNRMYFYAKKCQYTAGSDGERDGITTIGVEAALVGGNDDFDDEYRLAFY